MEAAVGESSDYIAQPDCRLLEPAPCKIIPVLDENGQVSYDDYEVRFCYLYARLYDSSTLRACTQSNDGCFLLCQ